MIISAKLIKKPRRPRRCDMCSVESKGAVIRNYGAPSTQDRPYVIFMCLNCAKDFVLSSFNSVDAKKVNSALNS